MAADPWYLVGWLAQGLVGVVEAYDHDHAVDQARETLREFRKRAPLEGFLAENVDRACRRVVDAEPARRINA